MPGFVEMVHASSQEININLKLWKKLPISNATSRKHHMSAHERDEQKEWKLASSTNHCLHITHAEHGTNHWNAPTDLSRCGIALHRGIPVPGCHLIAKRSWTSQSKEQTFDISMRCKTPVLQNIFGITEMPRLTSRNVGSPCIGAFPFPGATSVQRTNFWHQHEMQDTCTPKHLWDTPGCTSTCGTINMPNNFQEGYRHAKDGSTQNCFPSCHLTSQVQGAPTHFAMGPSLVWITSESHKGGT